MSFSDYAHLYPNVDYARLYIDETARSMSYANEISVLRDRINRLLTENASLKALLSERNNEVFRLNRVNAVLEDRLSRMLEPKAP